MNVNYNKHPTTKKAFTLIELVIVMTFILIMVNLAMTEIRNQKMLKNELYLTENLDLTYKYALDTVRATRHYSETKTITNLQAGLASVKSETRSGFRYIDYEKDSFKDIDGAHYIYILHNGLDFKNDLDNINVKNTIFLVITKTRVEVYYTTDIITRPIIYKQTNI